MNTIAIFAIAIALAVDAFAVALTTGARLKQISTSVTLQVGGTFGGFQFLMPVVGWWLGNQAQKYIEEYDHWVAFVILVFVGVRMIREVWAHKSGADAAYDPTHKGTLLLLGIATSLDALAVGLSFAMLEMGILLSAIIIGIVTFVISVTGLHMGRLITRLPGLGTLGTKANIFGGVVLIVIGINILQQHHVF